MAVMFWRKFRSGLTLGSLVEYNLLLSIALAANLYKYLQGTKTNKNSSNIKNLFKTFVSKSERKGNF